jgi:hypothetical protein
MSAAPLDDRDVAVLGAPSVRDAVSEDSPWVLGVRVACIAWAGACWELATPRFGVAGAAVGVAVAAFLAFDSRRVLAAPLVARERASLEALPFRVDGYFAALAEPATATATAVVVLELERAMTPEEEARLEGTARAIGAEVAAIRGARVEIRRHDVASVGRRGPSNGALLRVQRELVARVLVPLHAVVPIRAASFLR